MAPIRSVTNMLCCTFVRRLALLFFSLTHNSTILPSIPHVPVMSHTHPTSTSSDFQLIFDNALKAYEKCTKKDLLTHPLGDRLEACDSANSILTVLQEQVQELNQSQRRNKRWTRWLDPTVKVLLAFSETLGEGVTLVCLSSPTCLRSALSYLFDRHFHRQKPSLLQSASFFWYVSFLISSWRPS